jgi:hypothetical protein
LQKIGSKICAKNIFLKIEGRALDATKRSLLWWQEEEEEEEEEDGG